jgi:pantoate kinase
MAFAPAAITNFFSIHDEGLSRTPPDLMKVGATGGGYMLSKGVNSRAELLPEAGRQKISIVVNGDESYDARTTRKAVELLLRSAKDSRTSLRIEQTVEVPIGYGFGASAASALSGVFAAASVLELRRAKSELAFYAHSADILCRTGLGTVSAIYDHGGAGIMTRPGGPGVAVIENIVIPRGLRIVTASLAPYEKSIILSESTAKSRVNALGEDALIRASDMSMESLVRAGEVFTEGLAVATPEVMHLAKVAKEHGAMGASQNMVGQAVHALVFDEDVRSVSAALSEDGLSPIVAVYDFGSSAH